MSTGQECQFVERNPNEWWLLLESARYGGVHIEFNEYGPFKTWARADAYLRRNFANPGGFILDPHPDSTDRSWE